MKQSRRRHRIVPLALYISTTMVFLAILALSTASWAGTSNRIAFAWSPNPPADNITGYRLYFGPESRFTNSGAPKAGFQYPSYIDFSTSLLCTGANYSHCEYLDGSKLQCHDIYNSPVCTVAVPRGVNYYSLKAYNYAEESSYSGELQYPKTKPVSTKPTPITPVIMGLLLDS